MALLTRRKAGVAAGVVLVLIFLGCMSIAIGNRTPEGTVLEDGTLVQNGEATVPPGCEQDVYYPIPYARPPHLDVSSSFDECVLVEQREDHFRVKNVDHTFSHSVTWKARGMRCLPSPCAPASEPPLAPPPTPVPASPAAH
jgi:hypothetical protein